MQRVIHLVVIDNDVGDVDGDDHVGEDDDCGDVDVDDHVGEDNDTVTANLQALAG